MYDLIGSLSNDDGDVNENVKKAVGLDWQYIFARASRFFVHVFAVTARLRRDSALYFTFCGGREHKTTLFFLFCTSIWYFTIQLQTKCPTFDELNEME